MCKYEANILFIFWKRKRFQRQQNTDEQEWNKKKYKYYNFLRLCPIPSVSLYNNTNYVTILNFFLLFTELYSPLVIFANLILSLSPPRHNKKIDTLSDYNKKVSYLKIVLFAQSKFASFQRGRTGRKNNGSEYFSLESILFKRNTCIKHSVDTRGIRKYKLGSLRMFS